MLAIQATSPGSSRWTRNVVASIWTSFSARAGLEGHLESFAYTEVDNTAAIGADLRGALWHRDGDKLGIAAVSNGLSDDHRRYLALGGKGFLLGDGHLRYGREILGEAYYTAQLYRGIFIAGDIQLIGRPGYNRDRGPITVGSLRIHLEL